jgi:flagellar assembly protein FliH
VATVSSDQGSSAGKIPAWERWDPGVLHTQPTPQAPERRAPVSPDAIARRAHAEGFEKGQQAGRQAGYNEGRARAQAEAAQIHAVAQAAQAALQALGDTLASKTVTLAAAIAKKIMQREMQHCPDNLLDVVRDALTLLPDNTERVRIVVNSADVELVRAAINANGNPPASECVVTGADDLPRGGCRIVAPGGDIDATLATRTARVLEALGLPDKELP